MCHACVAHFRFTAHCKQHTRPNPTQAGRALAAGLPFAHFNNSHLACALTGQRMDHANPPMALPNGRVYSRRAVHELLSVTGPEGEPRVRCPRTGETFPLAQLRTIFII